MGMFATIWRNINVYFTENALWSDRRSFSIMLAFTSCLIVGSFDPLDNQPLRSIDINPLADVAPLVFLQILVMREKVRDLISSDLRQVAIGIDAVIKRMQVIDRHR